MSVAVGSTVGIGVGVGSAGADVLVRSWAGAAGSGADTAGDSASLDALVVAAVSLWITTAASEAKSEMTVAVGEVTDNDSV